ncbi:MAG: hypothetical protein ACOYBQ_10275 [Fluviibacter sp.]
MPGITVSMVGSKARRVVAKKSVKRNPEAKKPIKRNPSKHPFHQFTYNVEAYLTVHGDWTVVGGFDNPTYAKDFGQYYADKTRRKVRIVDALGL